MNRAIAPISVMLSVLVSACVTNGDSRQDSPSGETKAPLEVRAFHGSCIYDDGQVRLESFGLAEIFGAAVISNTLNRLGKALRRAGEEDAYIETASRNLQSLQPCIQIVKGRFSDDANNWIRAKEFLPEPISGADVDNRLMEAEIFLVSEPDFIFEGRVVQSRDGSALAVRPNFYSYRSPLKAGRKANKAYGILVSVSFHPPGKAANSPDATGASLALGSLQPSESTYRVYAGSDSGVGTGNEAGSAHPHESHWFSSISKTPDVASALQPRSTEPGGNQQLRTGPWTVSVAVTETRKANEVLLFFADVFDDSQEELQTQLEQSLIPSVGNAADIADYTSQQSAVSSYYTNLAAAETSKAEACAVFGDESSTPAVRISIAAEFFAAQGVANVAAMTAGLALPYPSRKLAHSLEDLNCPI